MKNKTTAALFAGFLGFFGVHKFYLGQTGLGILYFLTGGLFFIGAIIDFISLLSMDEYSFNQKFNAAYMVSSAPQVITKSISPSKVADELKKLHELKESGIISDLEFDTQKERLLN